MDSSLEQAGKADLEYNKIHKMRDGWMSLGGEQDLCASDEVCLIIQQHQDKTKNQILLVVAHLLPGNHLITLK